MEYCHSIECSWNDFLPYLYWGGLTEEAQIAVRAHLQDCTKCQEELEKIQEIDHKTQPAIPPSQCLNP